MSRTLIRTSWRYLLRHPWQSLLMLLGITLGVAVVTAIDLANASAGRAFQLSTESVTGRATHQVTGGVNGLPEEVFTRLRLAGRGSAAAPLVNAIIEAPVFGSRPITLLGVDPFSEPPFRDYLGARQGAAAAARPTPLTGDLAAFLTQPGAVIISAELARLHGLEACPTGVVLPECRLELVIAGRTHTALIVGLVEPADDLSRRALDSLVLADIATAQELTGRLGLLDTIDLILPEGSQADSAALLEHIGLGGEEGVLVQPVAARLGAVEQMTAAFQVNLTALSLLALVVGMFLIYNTMTFAVVQRRPMYGTLRCLGVTRGEIFSLVVLEAGLVGLLGALLGLALGVLMGQGAIRLVTQTITDLFFTISVRGVQIPPASLVKGLLLGVVATLLTAAPPAWEAASVPPRAALSRSGLESKALFAVRLAALGGAALILLGGALLLVPTRSLVVSFTATFMIVIGCALLAPLATRLLLSAAIRPLGGLWGTLGRMAPRTVIGALSRTAIAVAALMVAVSVTIGVSLMVGSFRHTVVLWLAHTLQGDIYISVPTATATQVITPLDPRLVASLADWPGVEEALLLRSVEVDSPDGLIHVTASSNPHVSQERRYLATDVPESDLPAAMAAGAVIVSEPLANRLELPRHGGQITLFTPAGQQTFDVVGIYYDYASPQGTLTLALPVYQRIWQDTTITSAALLLEPGVQVDAVNAALQTGLAQYQQANIRPNQALRAEVLEVFDRTFAITGALQLLATVVAFIGILSALLSLELERQRELGILRAVGLTVRQLWGLVSLETGLMGAAAGLLSLPTGYVLALILVFIINRRAFGWTLQMQTVPGPFLQALMVALIAALLAGIYPAYRMGKTITSTALRSE